MILFCMFSHREIVVVYQIGYRKNLYTTQKVKIPEDSFEKFVYVK